MSRLELTRITLVIEPFSTDGYGLHKVRATVYTDLDHESLGYANTFLIEPNHFKPYFDRLWERAGEDVKRFLLQEEMNRRGALAEVKESMVPGG